MKKMTIEERKKRVIARGEHSGHSHIITGDVEVYEKDGKTLIKIGENQNACLKHLMEADWLKGKETWTKEHSEIPLKGRKQIRQGDVLLKQVSERVYQYIPQIEKHPYNDFITRVDD